MLQFEANRPYFFLAGYIINGNNCWCGHINCTLNSMCEKFGYDIDKIRKFMKRHDRNMRGPLTIFSDSCICVVYCEVKSTEKFGRSVTSYNESPMIEWKDFDGKLYYENSIVEVPQLEIDKRKIL